MNESLRMVPIYGEKHSGLVIVNDSDEHTTAVAFVLSVPFVDNA